MLGGALHLYLSLDNLYWLPLDHPPILCNYLNHKKFPSEEKDLVVLGLSGWEELAVYSVSRYVPPCFIMVSTFILYTVHKCPCDELFIMLLPVLLNLQSYLLIWEWTNGIGLQIPLLL